MATGVIRKYYKFFNVQGYVWDIILQVISYFKVLKHWFLRNMYCVGGYG